MEINPNTRLIDLTVGELFDIVTAITANRTPETAAKRHAYGLAGIASIFNCSMRTAARIKASGVIDGAISQCGRTIVVDIDKAIYLFKSNK